MGTPSHPDNLAAVLFGKTRQAVLALLYGHPDEWFYVRQIVRNAGVGQGAVQRELRRLWQVGILVRRVDGRQVYYQADPRCPIYDELRSLTTKTVGAAGVLWAALASLTERIQLAFIYGSLAEGKARSASDVDLLVVGDVTFAGVATALSPVQERLGREVNPTVYPPSEFRQKLAEGHHFLTAVRSRPKIYLIGDDDEFARLAESRMA
jgi:predicted nucleotidyltransferase